MTGREGGGARLIKAVKEAADGHIARIHVNGQTWVRQDCHDEVVEALQEIERWADAYPLSIFPEPDFEKVRELLAAGGITLDAVSASNMRHVVEGVGKIARSALSRARGDG